MSDIRREFEAKFPLEKGVMWNDVSKAYTVSASYEDWAESNVHAHQTNIMWQAYQAAHKAQQAEIDQLKDLIGRTLEDLRMRANADSDGYKVLELSHSLVVELNQALEGNQ